MGNTKGTAIKQRDTRSYEKALKNVENEYREKLIESLTNGMTEAKKAAERISKDYQGVKYHRTDGGAEYIETESGSIVRLDCQEFEIMPEVLKRQGFNRIKIGEVVINL